jgi:hypothetical protein
MKHGSATVAFADYCSVLDAAEAVLPPNCQITLLADRGFEHGELIRCGSVPGESSPGHLPWLRSHQWSWAIRAQSDLRVTLSNAQAESVCDLLPEPEQAFLFNDVMILGDIQCHLATARLSMAHEAWAVITDTPPSVQTFALYGQRFGGIEPHFKDYKSAAFELPRSKLRDAEALSRLLMLLATATIVAISVAVAAITQGALNSIDWHAHRELSFLQIGLRRINQLCYQRLPLPPFRHLPRCNPPPAYASLKKRDAMNSRIEFAKITVF